LGSKLPPADFSFGMNLVKLPFRSLAPLMKLWNGHTDGSPYVATWWMFRCAVA